VDFLILDAVIKANTTRPNLMFSRIKKFLGCELKGKKFAVLGLTYKAGTDDLRNSPAIDLINLLLQEGSKVVAYDPRGMQKAGQYFGERLNLAPNAFEATKGADAIIIATEWPEFTALDYKEIRNQLAQPLIIDLRNILDRKTLVDLGYRCYFVGGKTEPSYMDAEVKTSNK
jgi:UDPglucose 6-dehydrogenase